MLLLTNVLFLVSGKMYARIQEVTLTGSKSLCSLIQGFTNIKYKKTAIKRFFLFFSIFLCIPIYARDVNGTSIKYSFAIY